MSSITLSLKTWSARRPTVFLAASALLWLIVYQALIPVSETLVSWLPVERESHLGGALGADQPHRGVARNPTDRKSVV